MGSFVNDKLTSEKELVYLMLHHRHAIEQVYNSGLSHKHFDDELKPIVLSIFESYDVDDVLLTRKTFREKLSRYKVPKDRIVQELAFDSCYIAKADINDLPHLVAKILERYIDVAVNSALGVFRDNRNTKGTITAVRELVDSCDGLLDGTSTGERTYFQDMRILTIEKLQYIEDVVSGKIEEEPPLLTGIREVDYTMATGLEYGTLTLFCADVGCFKSSMMLNIGMNVWDQGHDVLFVPLEMHRDQMWRRAMARDARVDSKLLINNLKAKMTPEIMEKMRETQKRWDENQSKFFIMQEPGNTTVTTVQKLIERNIDLVKPKLVVIDYVANLKAHKNRYGRNDLEIGDMLKAMRQMGKDLHFAIISGAQIGREALRRLRKAGANKDKPTVNSEDIRGSHEYGADADNIYAQLRSTSQPNQLLDLYCVKSRNGATLFEGDNVRAVLEVYPQFGLIKSAAMEGETHEVNDIIIGDYVDKTEIDNSIISKGSGFFDEEDSVQEASIETGMDDLSDIANSVEDQSRNEVDIW